MPPLAPGSWLFVKGDETIWIVRPEKYVLLVCGPGALQEHQSFDSEDALEGFQVWLAEELISSGWILWGIDRDRRSGRDRRLAGRETPERRLGSPAAGTTRVDPTIRR